MSSRASAGQALKSKLGHKVLSRIEDGKTMEGIDGGRGEGDLLGGEKWEAGCRDEGVERREVEEGNDIMGAGSVSARQESRADLASSEDYCKFSTGKNTSCITESRQDVESVLSKCPDDVEEHEGEAPKVSHDPIYLRDVQMSYKRYRNRDTGFMLTGLGASEISPRGMSGLISARSTQSEPVKSSKHRSDRSRNNFPPEMSPFPTTISEDGSCSSRTICSSSVVSSMPRRALSHREPVRRERDTKKNGSQSLEPTRARLETPEIPRLGLTSDLNDTNRSLFSNERNEPAEDYTTAEQLVRQHPDTRASEGHVSSRAGERDYANKDGRAEEKCFEGVKLDNGLNVALQESITKDSGNFEIKADPHESNEPKNVGGTDAHRENTNSLKDECSLSKKVEADRESVTSRSSKHRKSSRGSNKPDQETSATSEVRVGDEKSPTVEIERGEDEARNTEMDRGHETVGSSSALGHKEKKRAIERGDDLSETFHEETRLSQSARRRGQSQYRTTAKSERGLEREYFTPQTHQAEKYILPNVDEIEDSLVDASELNSRPSSAASSDISQISESKRKKKSLRRFSKTSNASKDEKELVVRPASAVSKDGRGDDSHSVASGAQTSVSKGKQAPDGNNELHRPESETSHKSHETMRSTSSRGSVNGKDKPGKNQNYQVANAESIGRGLDDNSHTVAVETSLVFAGGKDQPPNKGGEAASSTEAKTGKNNEVQGDSDNSNQPCPEEDCINLNGEMVGVSSTKYNTEHGEAKANEQSFLEQRAEHIDEALSKQEMKNATTANQAVSEIISYSHQDKEDNSPEDQIEEGDPDQAMDNKRHKSPSPTTEDVPVPAVLEERPPGTSNKSIKYKENLDGENLKIVQYYQMDEQNQGFGGGDNNADLPVTSAEQSRNQEDNPSVDIVPQEKAFVDSSDTTEIVKAPVSACVSLEADNTVIEFRPSSASTAKSFTADHEIGAQNSGPKEKHVKSFQPSRIVEVTESEGTPTPGRDTHRAIYGNNEIIQTEYVLPAHIAKNKQVSDTGQVLDLAQITTEPKLPEEMEMVHPGMKKRGSKSSISSKNSSSEKKKDHVGSSEKNEIQSRNDLHNQNEMMAQKQRQPSISCTKSTDQKIADDRPLSASSQRSFDKAMAAQRPPSPCNQKSADKIKEKERPTSASSQKSVEKVKDIERPPSASSQKTIEKVKDIERPASACSQKSIEKVKDIERPPSASSQKSVEKVKDIERPPSASTQKSAEKVKDIERPPSASSQKSIEKVKDIERPPSASSQKSAEKVKDIERPPSASSQKSVEKMKDIERPPSASSQKSAEKVKDIERPPSASSQKSVEKVKYTERPPSASSHQSVEKVKDIERPLSASSQKSVDKVKDIEIPPSASTQKSVEKMKDIERPPSASSQKSVEKVKDIERSPSASSQKSAEKVKDIERPPSASSQKSVDKVKYTERPPSASSQKTIEKVKDIERPASASSQKSVEKVKDVERPPSIKPEVC